jgi:predicted ATPase/DNA-binding SARP family transcriptional activator
LFVGARLPSRSFSILKLTSFGELGAALGDQPINLAQRGSRRIAQQLLVLLLIAYPARLSRESACERLLPLGDKQAANAKLHQALHALRRLIEPGLGARKPSNYVLSDREHIFFADSARVEVDSRYFEAGTEPDASLVAKERALALYRGEWLAAHDLRASELARRESLHLRFRRCALSVAKEQSASGHVSDATRTLETLVTIDPFFDDGCLALMQILTQQGRTEDALRRYQALFDGLQNELDAEPSEPIASYARNLRKSEASAVASSANFSLQKDTVSSHRFHAPTSIKRLVVRIALLRRIETDFFERGYRLLTLCGLGGIGKSTLASQLALTVNQRFELGTCWVALPLETLDRASLSMHLLKALDLAGARGEPDSVIRKFIGAKSLMLVIDNYIANEDGNRYLHELLTQCAGLKLLVTARTVLDIEGEHVVQVSQMRTPDVLATREAQLKDIESVQLFLLRAEDVHTEFRLNEANAKAIAEICRATEGYPLALELAALRLRAYSPGELSERIRANVTYLAGAPPSDVDAPRSLDASLAWAFESASPAARRLLAWLSLQHADLNAKLLAPLHDHSIDTIAELLHALHLLGLLQRRAHLPDSDVAWYHMLDTVREYAFRCLLAIGEKSAATEWLNERVLRSARLTVRNHLLVLGTPLWLGAGIDARDLAATVERSLAQSRPLDAIEAFECLATGLFEQTRFIEFVHYRDQFFALADAALPRVRGTFALLCGIDRALGYNDATATESLLKASEELLEVGDVAGAALALRYRALLLVTSDKQEAALSAAQRAQQLCESVSDENFALKTLSGVVFVFLSCERPREARKAAERVVALASSPSVTATQRSSAFLAACQVFHQCGEIDRAHELASDAFALASAQGNKLHIGLTRYLLVELSIARHRLREAAEHLANLEQLTSEAGGLLNERARNVRLRLALALATGDANGSMLDAALAMNAELKPADAAPHRLMLGLVCAEAALMCALDRGIEAVRLVASTTDAFATTTRSDHYFAAQIVCAIAIRFGNEKIVQTLRAALVSHEHASGARSVGSDLVFIDAISKERRLNVSSELAAPTESLAHAVIKAIESLRATLDVSADLSQSS